MGQRKLWISSRKVIEDTIVIQIRQIVKELVRMDFDDVYSTTRSEQEEVFFRVVKKYSKVHEGRIRAFLAGNGEVKGGKLSRIDKFKT
jgi:hypothetical protein